MDETQAPQDPQASTSATSVENGFGRAVWVLTWSSETKVLPTKQINSQDRGGALFFCLLL